MSVKKSSGKVPIIIAVIAFILVFASVTGKDHKQDDAVSTETSAAYTTEAETEVGTEAETEAGTEAETEAAHNETTAKTSAATTAPSVKTTTSAAEYTTSKKAADSGNSEQRRAIKTAESYLSFTAFSKQGLIDQLEYEGYPADIAAYAAENCGADWDVQAAAKALEYLQYTSFSYSGLVE